MKTLADLKRAIRPGVRLLVVNHEYRPELTGTTRTVTDVQGNGYFYLSEGDSKRSWSGYAKASCYSFPEPDTYKHDEGALCSCGHRNSVGDITHSPTCNVTTGKHIAWTIKVINE